MLAANVCAADFIQRGKHPSLYRVHEGPTPEKLEILRNYLKAMGVPHQLSDDPTPSEYEAISVAARERPDALQIQTMLLRSMQQAIYTPTNGGHFGLSYEAYTHFTSPIRRYPDLLVHRVIKAILAREKYAIAAPAAPATPSPSTRRPRAASATAKPLKGEALVWEAAGLHCSANERRADEASRDVQAWLKCKFMHDHLGETFDGKVTAVTGFGLFVTLNDMYVEGLVHISELGGDYYKFDELRQELRGERSGIRYALGSKLHVQVGRVDLDARRIDFRVVDPLNAVEPERRSTDGAGTKGAARRRTAQDSPATKKAAKASPRARASQSPEKRISAVKAQKGAQAAASRKKGLKTAKKNSKRG